MKSHDSHLILEHLRGHLRILIPKLPEIFQWTLRPPMTRRRKPGPVTVTRYHFNCQLARASKTDEKRLKHGVPKKFNVDSVISLLFNLFPAESLWWWIFLELADSLIFSPYFFPTDRFQECWVNCNHVWRSPPNWWSTLTHTTRSICIRIYVRPVVLWSFAFGLFLQRCCTYIYH